MLPSIAKKNFTTHGLSNTYEYRLCLRAKTRAKDEGVPFDLTPEDIIIPEKCPVLGVSLVRHQGESGYGEPDSPSLDKLIPQLGYTKRNVRVISKRANMIKSNATPVELFKVATWLQVELSV